MSNTAPNSRTSYAAQAGFADGCDAFDCLPPRRRNVKTRLNRDYIARELDGREASLCVMLFAEGDEPALFCMRN
jgi:hypothetical protein